MSLSQSPKIRFRGYADEWEQRKLEDVVEFLDTMRKPLEGAKRVQGPYPYYGASGIVDYVDGYLFDEELILLSEDGANITDRNYPVCFLASGKYWVNNHAHVLKSKSGNENNFICNSLERKDYKQYNSGMAMPKLNQEVCRGIPVTCPSYDEQKKIGDYFRNLDNLITLHQRKYYKLVNVKKSMLEKMFPRNGSDIPEIRFAGFTDAWEQRKLGELMDVTSVKRIHQSDWTDSGIRFLRARDIVAESKNEEVTEPLFISEEKYEEYSALSGKVKPGDLLVTGVGTIGVPMLIKSDEPVYFKDGNIIWFKNENTIDGKFFYHSFNGEGVQKFIKESAGIGTVGTYTIDSGKKTPINLPPSKEEQIKIGGYFESLDNLITLHQHKLEKWKNIKQSLVAKMFV